MQRSNASQGTAVSGSLGCPLEATRRGAADTSERRGCDGGGGSGGLLERPSAGEYRGGVGRGRHGARRAAADTARGAGCSAAAWLAAPTTVERGGPLAEEGHEGSRVRRTRGRADMRSEQRENWWSPRRACAVAEGRCGGPPRVWRRGARRVCSRSLRLGSWRVRRCRRGTASEA